MAFSTNTVKRILWENKDVGRINQEALNTINLSISVFIESIVQEIVNTAVTNNIPRLDDYSIKEFAETEKRYAFLSKSYSTFKDEESKHITIRKRRATKSIQMEKVNKQQKLNNNIDNCKTDIQNEDKPTESTWNLEEETFDDI